MSKLNFLETLRNIWAIEDLRKRVLFTFGLLAVYRLGSHIPTPGVDPVALAEFFKSAGGALGFLDLFSGGALRRLSVFALGIMPYISASIILQLLTVVWPYLEKLSKEGEMGRRKINQYTRYGTVVLSIVQSLGVAFWLKNQPAPGGAPLVPQAVQDWFFGIGFPIMTVLTLTTGTAFVMWLGEQISERGIGNGISLIIFAGIVVNLPHAVFGIAEDVLNGQRNLFAMLALIVFMAAVVAFVVFMERAQRRIPVQYAKRVVGRKVYGGSNTYLPLRVNTAGVIPVIFASSILVIPQTLASMIKTPWAQAIGSQMRVGEPLYYLLQVVGIVFFCYFYTSIVFNPVDTADNMRKYGGFIPGIRPGKKTSDYIDRVLTRITFVGSLYLAAVCILPEFLIAGVHVAQLPFGIGAALDRALPLWFTEGMGFNFYFGGTSLLIVVGVAMDTIQQIESQLVMRHYDGFMKRGRIRGRRG
ncbi:MAG: preprotein translocase subunit SecY [Acidobacteria bacterium]|nr:preprotein translocase subunit SecY [Acidobacteriota bacterium]MBV9068330.1 preprotein translocase subunit SecY [Acidobacteriota bacterium]MBV9185580.1 preprotein translocase subunit SecY [Acidobacteriota bacterium]